LCIVFVHLKVIDVPQQSSHPPMKHAPDDRILGNLFGLQTQFAQRPLDSLSLTLGLHLSGFRVASYAVESHLETSKRHILIR
jgi:hypothetical protein